MILRVLGCSGSEADRNHPCSFLVGKTTVLDMGSAASRLTISEQVNIRDIFLSHAHLDHTKDLAFFSENVFVHVKEAVTIRGTKDTLRKVNDHLLNNEIWPDFTILPTKSKSVLKYEPVEPGQTLKLPDLEVMAVPVHHPGGCIALLFKSKTGTIVYSGDTGPTEEIWNEVNKRGQDVKAILLETSFPNRLQQVAEISGHHTPNSLAGEIKKITNESVPIFVYHIKAPYRVETIRELEEIDDGRIRVLEPGMEIEF